MNLFNPVVEEKKLNKFFLGYHRHRVYEPGRCIADEIFDKMGDKDGNFIKDFQSGGFWGRLHELFLFEFLTENGCQIINDCDRPDFHLMKDGIEFFIEASSSNPTNNEEVFIDKAMQEALWAKDEEMARESVKQYSIKIASVLFSKLNKKYWELGWVSGKPLLLAITAQHNILSSFLPDYKISEYLYGIEVKTMTNEAGELIGINSKLENHSLGEKIIPSGFFNQPNSEYISGVIFSNTSDFMKFNRMGFENGYADKNIKMLRSGQAFNAASKSYANSFQYEVGKNLRKETWSEGIHIFHNPKALFPLDTKLFTNVAQSWPDENGVYTGMPFPNFYPQISRTFIWDLKFLKEKYPTLKEESIHRLQLMLTLKVFESQLPSIQSIA